MAPIGKVYPDFVNDSSPPPPPAGAYYSTKDQPLPPPATYQAPGGRRRGRGPCCCLFTWLCSVLVILSIAIGITVLVLWLVVQPRAPKYYVDNVSITGLDGSNTATTTLNTAASINITVRNPNTKIGFYYDDIWVTVETQGFTIAQGNLPPFYQGHKNTSYVTGTVSSSVAVDSDSRSLISTTATSNNVALYAKVDVKARIKLGSWKSRKMTMKVRCNINVDLTKPEGSQLISASCKIKN